MTPAKGEGAVANGSPPKAARKQPTRAQAQAALAEMKAPKPRVVQWRDLELIMPPELPATLGLDFAEVQALEQQGDGEAAAVAYHWFMTSLLGAQQWRTVRLKLAETPLSQAALTEILTDDLLTAVLAPYGVGPGESQASAAS